MADPIVFGVFDASGLPAPSAVPVVVSGNIYDHVTGAARSAPVVFNRGDGQHGVEPSAADEAVGCVALIDAGVGFSFESGSRYLALTIPEAAQFEAFVLTDSTDALWVGADPAFQSYDGRSGTLLPQPGFVKPTAGLYCFAPSASDIAAGVSYRVDAPVNAFPQYLFGSATAPSVGPYSPPSSGTYPADAVAQTLAGVIALPTPPGGTPITLTYAPGGNLLVGPVRAVEGAVPQLAVFVLQSGGPAPRPYMGDTQSWHVSRVQVTVRGAMAQFAQCEALARALHARLHENTPAGYTYCLAQESDPLFTGLDEEGAARLVFNVELGHRR